MTSAGVWVVFCIVTANLSEIFARTSLKLEGNSDQIGPSTRLPTPTCKGNEWRCSNGECIKHHDLCDGQPTCEDKSDETFAACSQVQCPSYLFRCAYGACADGDAKCNGKSDCADDSDELHKDCKTMVVANTCGKLKFQCSNGDCIDRNRVCDGSIDCFDGSDETVTECSELKCSDLSFKCAYGACVDGDSPCNGVDNCFDGSDEIPELCNNKENNKPVNEIHCIVPEHKGCTIRVIGDLSKKQYVKPFAMLHHSCPNDNLCQFCDPEGSLSELFTCPSICDAFPGKNNDTECTFDSKIIDCDTPLLSGSKMNVRQPNELYMVYCSNNVWHKIQAQRKYKRDRMSR